MPYILNEDRDRARFNPETEGELNYAICMLARKYLEDKGENYATYNAIVGAMELAKQEFIWRKIRTYEDKKIKENGDVF